MLRNSVNLGSLRKDDPFELTEVMHLLYKDIPEAVGQMKSREDRLQMGYYSPTLSFSELSQDNMRTIFDRLEGVGWVCENNSHFVDIGCGVGKQVFMAALLYDFTSCKGIEIVSELHQICADRQVKWNHICIRMRLRKKLHIEMGFNAGDASVIDWSQGTVILAYSTAFDQKLMDAIAVCGERVAPGAYLITISTTITSNLFDLVDSFELALSWGKATCFIYRRRDQQPDGYMDDVAFLRSVGIGLKKRQAPES